MLFFLILVIFNPQCEHVASDTPRATVTVPVILFKEELNWPCYFWQEMFKS